MRNPCFGRIMMWLASLTMIIDVAIYVKGWIYLPGLSPPGAEWKCFIGSVVV